MFRTFNTTARHLRPPTPAVWVALTLFAFCLASLPARASDEAFARSVDDPELQWGPCPDFMPEGCEIAILQGDPAAENADILFRLPANTTAERHWHTSAERMVLVAGELRVAYDDQDAVVMQPGTYAYGPPELPHSAECLSDEACVLFIAFEQPIDAEPGEKH